MPYLSPKYPHGKPKKKGAPKLKKRMTEGASSKKAPGQAAHFKAFYGG